MKVQGVDPIIMNRIHEKVRKQAVQDMRQTEISRDRENRQEQEQEKRNPDRKALTAAVKKLNSTAETFGPDILFVMIEEGIPRIFMVDKKTEQVIRELPLEKILSIIEERGSFVGMAVDHLL